MAAFLLAGILPAAAESAGDYMGASCADGDATCERTQKDFEKWFPEAYKGDYQSQRNVAFCLATGCDGAILVKPIKACAWRAVIVSSGSPEVDQSDTTNLDQDCGKLSPTEVEAAKAQADRIAATIKP